METFLHSAGLAEIAVRLCLNQRSQLCPHIWVPILKPRRSCIRDRRRSAVLSRAFPLIGLDDEDDDFLLPVGNKRVVFADARGFSLTAVREFSEDEEPPDLELLPGLGSMTEDGYSCTVSTGCPGTRLTLGFPPPAADFPAFRAKLAERMVVLEHCSVSRAALRGTVRVRNISFQKDVRVRVTFDSWRSCRDVACTHLPERFGGPNADVFQFAVAVPNVLDAKRKIEFCVMFAAGGRSEAFWDNNDGRNYSVAVSVSSHLCGGKNPREGVWPNGAAGRA